MKADQVITAGEVDELVGPSIELIRERRTREIERALGGGAAGEPASSW
jgi:hypothetical protein